MSPALAKQIVYSSIWSLRERAPLRSPPSACESLPPRRRVGRLPRLGLAWAAHRKCAIRGGASFRCAGHTARS
jgi:hypothetical protein